MNKQEIELAKTPDAVSKLLDSLEGVELNSPETTSYNYLIEYLEYPEWFSSHEGERLLGLSLEVLHLRVSK